MIPRALMIAAFAGIMLTFFSCKKCTECSFVYQGTTYSSGEKCGKTSDVDLIQEEWEKDAAALGTSATCVDK